MDILNAGLSDPPPDALIKHRARAKRLRVLEREYQDHPDRESWNALIELLLPERSPILPRRHPTT